MSADQRPLFLVFVVSGEQTAAGIASGRGNMTHLVAAIGNESPTIIGRESVTAFLQRHLDYRRVYGDALLARVIERQLHGYSVCLFDNAKTLRSLLGTRDGEESAPACSNAILDAYRRMQAIRGTFGPDRQQILCEHLENAYAIELGAIDPTAAMSLTGVGIDVAAVNSVDLEANQQLRVLEADVLAATGFALQISSNESIKALVANLVGIQQQSTDVKASKEYLETIRHRHPLIPRLMEGIDARTAVYACNQVRQHLSPNGRVYPDFDPFYSRTGRFRCVHPALQSLPKRFRHFVIARLGYLLFELDIAHADARSLAALSGDLRLQQMLRSRNGDYYRELTAQLLRPTSGEVTEQQRERIGKPFANGCYYGMGVDTLVEYLRCDREYAAAMLRQFRESFPQAADKLREVGAAHLREGYSRTFFGTKCFAQARQDEHMGHGAAGAIQGTTSNLIKLAMARVMIRFPGLALQLTNHDSLLLEVPHDASSEYLSAIKSTFEESPPGFPVPLYARAKIGRNWGEMTEIC